jgi:hypothetical protein
MSETKKGVVKSKNFGKKIHGSFFHGYVFIDFKNK